MSEREEDGLAGLRARISHLERSISRPGSTSDALPFGVDPIDQALPGGGLKRAALHEFVPGGSELPHAAACTLFVAGILARLDGPVLWCMPSRAPFPPALARVGLRPDRVVYAEPFREAALLPIIEEGAHFSGLAGVVGDVGRIGLTESRRLQLASEASGVTVLLLRRIGRKQAESVLPNAAATRWRVSAHPSTSLSSIGFGRPLWRVELERCRGAQAGTPACSWLVQGCDEAGRLALPADLADRPHPQARPHRAAAG
ncbi:damage-inducible mutagenesis protein [Methylobacterium sp. C25]|uniref:ImuA family protein n=1 Tax=Methylobacterium sp. C25 TaxID=2721622 RepID=UPI001F2093A2|nr:damage-inducible mutagenesis protein [Methylobacterium sp. C25]MCE4224611.1 damage-inducible mutagenesis protein [Methylobacterium sp. C25]